MGSTSFHRDTPESRAEAGSTANVTYYSWRVARRDPKWLQKNTGWGSHRAVYPYAETENLSAHLVRMPGGQRAPWHAYPSTRENLFLCTVGEVEFSAASTLFPLKPLDMLFCRGVAYSYQNPGFSDSLFWVLNRRRVGASESRATGTSTTYYESVPGEDPDALDRMRFVRWDDYRRQFEWEQYEGNSTLSQTWGSHRCTYPYLEWMGVKGRMIRVPPAQKRANRIATDVLYVGLGGEMDFEFSDRTYRLSSLDVLAVAAGVPHEHVNVGMDDALFFEVTPTSEQSPVV
jgi:quercetin dioxygenase-like cupin family protein